MSSILVIGANCTFGSELIECLSQEYDSLILTETQERISDLYQNMEKYGETLKFKICELNVECVSDIEKLVINLEKEGYLISSLVYCAGINIIENSLEITEEQWDKLISINLKGFFFCSKEVIAHMIRNGISGRIVAIGSQHSVVVSRERAAYCASKGGMVQWRESWHLNFLN